MMCGWAHFLRTYSFFSFSPLSFLPIYFFPSMHNTKAFRGREHQPSPKYCAQSHFSVMVLVQPKLCDQTCPRDAKGMKWWAGSGGCVAGGVPEAFSFSGQSFQKMSFSLDDNDNAWSSRILTVILQPALGQNWHSRKKKWYEIDL